MSFLSRVTPKSRSFICQAAIFIISLFLAVFFQSFYQMSYSYLDHMTGFYLLITILSIAAMILTPGTGVSGENFSVSTYDKQILNTNVSHVSQSILGSSTIQEQRPIPTRISSLRSEAWNSQRFIGQSNFRTRVITPIAPACTIFSQGYSFMFI